MRRQEEGATRGTHRQVLVEGPGTHRLVAHTPRPPAAGEALVRVHAVGICGSDREMYEGNRPEAYVRYPVTPGHEWSGTVQAVGEGVPASLVGRKVVGEGFRNCQVCDRCHAGETTLCTAGYEETGFTQPGAMAATLTLPARLLHPLPDDADLTAAALLEPAACVAAAALKADAQPGGRVAVVGTGTLGMFAVQFLAAASPGELLCVGTRRDRAELARTFGATRFRTWDELTEPGADHTATGPDHGPNTGSAPPGADHTATGPDHGPNSHSAPPDAPGPSDLGTYDVVIETAGSASAAAMSATLLRRGGRLVLTGLPAAGATGLDPVDLVVRQIEVRTVFGAPPAAWAHTVRVFAAGLLSPLPMVTHELGLAEFGRAVELVGSGGPKVGKVLLKP